MKKHLSIVALLLMSTAIFAADKNGGKNTPTYHEKTVVFKVKEAYRNLCSVEAANVPVLQQAISNVQVTSQAKYFPRAVRPETQYNSFGKKYSDLTLTYKLTYSGNFSVESVIQKIKNSGVVDYAEPVYIHEMSYTPNDPNQAPQYFLTTINAYAAWDVWQGDTNVVIGIVDSGTDWDHPDLAPNIKLNYADPINGVDDDADGYIDNYRGWDISENDNSPMCVNSNHGSHVSGCASAATDNGIGVAGPGFKCKIMGVKVSLDASTTSIDNGYDGIVYAADHGCQVINCSWGRGGGASAFEESIIDYAVINKNSTVVVAAGNTGIDEEHYPSSYENAMRVVSTDNGDQVSGFSTFGYSADICAPGGNIFTTILDDSYAYESGTSMASPVTAGCAAMVKSKFPWMNSFQVAAQLRNTSDNIYPLNSGYSNRLGKGRVNLYTALTDTSSPSIVVSDKYLTDGNDDAFVIGDTIQLRALFTNMLKPSTNATVVLTAQSTAVTVLQNSFTIGALGTLDTISNYAMPFLIRIKPTAPTNTVVPLKLTITDGTYTDFHIFNVQVNVDYLNIAVNDVASTATSKGLIGYNGANQSGGGLGFTYAGSNLLYEAGLMIGQSGTQVSDCVRNGAGGSDVDFGSVQKVRRITPGISDFDAWGIINDNPSTADLPVTVTHQAFAWIPAPDNKYIMFDYWIKNTGTSALTNLYGGIFADWDIMVYTNNKGDEDASRKMGYCYSTDAGGLYGAIKVLSYGPFTHYALDNVTGGGGATVDPSDGFDDSEKYLAMSNLRAQSGNTVATGNDVLDVVATGPFSVNAGDSVRISFAIIAGDDLADIQASSDAAQIKYNTITGLNELKNENAFGLMAYPNPASDLLYITGHSINNENLKVEIKDALGQNVLSLNKGIQSNGSFSKAIDISELQSGNYFITVTGNNAVSVKPFVVIK